MFHHTLGYLSFAIILRDQDKECISCGLLRATLKFGLTTIQRIERLSRLMFTPHTHNEQSLAKKSLIDFHFPKKSLVNPGIIKTRFSSDFCLNEVFTKFTKNFKRCHRLCFRKICLYCLFLLK